jgi:hypothetical protein
VLHVKNFAVIRGNGETSFCNLALMDVEAPKVESFDVCIDVFFAKTLILTVIADMFLSSGLACENQGEGEDEFTERIALRRKGAGKGKKLLSPSRLMGPSAAGVVRAASASTMRQDPMFVMEEMIALIDWRADQ